LKEVLSAEWVMDGLKAGRTKAGGPETKKVAKWAREVSFSFFFSLSLLLLFR
jgi:importin subunit beta-1